MENQQSLLSLATSVGEFWDGERDRCLKIADILYKVMVVFALIGGGAVAALLYAGGFGAAAAGLASFVLYMFIIWQILSNAYRYRNLGEAARRHRLGADIVANLAGETGASFGETERDTLLNSILSPFSDAMGNVAGLPRGIGISLKNA